MPNINSIGRVEKRKNIYRVKLQGEYRKGLKGIENFSHIHLICVSEEGQLIYVAGLVEDYDEDNHVMTVLVKENERFVYENSTLELIDIKPYMPSEDNAEINNTNLNISTTNPNEAGTANLETVEDKKSELNKKSKNSITAHSLADDLTYGIDYAGHIRNTMGTAFLQYDNIENMPENISEYVHVIWWFEKYEKTEFRRILQVETPYESEGKTGVFACRAPIRPNPIAVTTVKVLKADYENGRIYISGIDSFDKTPFIGIMNYDCGADKYESDQVSLPVWAREWADHIVIEDSKKAQNSIEDEIGRMDKPALEWIKKYEIEKSSPISPLQEEDVDKALTASDYSKPTHIRVKAARENNLKDISVYIPYGKITAVVGVSGSGKSSLVMDTVYAECKRRMDILSNESLTQQRPEMDKMEGCLPVVMISQKEIRASANSTIGTFSGINNHLRSIYASIGQANYKSPDGINFKLTPASFSFLDPECRCQACNGRGVKLIPDVEKIIINPHISLFEGASPFLGKLKSFIESPNANWMKGQVVALAKENNIDLCKPWNELPEDFKNTILYGDEKKTVTFSFDNKKTGRKGDISRIVEGIFPVINRTYIEDDKKGMGSRFMSELPCEVCKGERLGPAGRLATLMGVRFPLVAKMTFDQLSLWIQQLKDRLPLDKIQLVGEHIDSILEQCKVAKNLGIDYLELNRELSMVSGGEAQRIKLLSAFMNHMTGILYIFDEPSRKLSSKEYGYIIAMMKQLTQEGNTVLMVEHNMDMIEIADYLLEIGPKAGAEGGYIMAEGRIEDVIGSKCSMLGKYAGRHDSYDGKRKRDKFQDWVEIKNVTSNNLVNLTTSFPKKSLTCLTGVSGSGKSTLMYQGIMPQMKAGKEFDSVILVESKITGNSSRSVVATYMGIMDEIRRLYAETDSSRERKLSEKDFSFNTGSLRCQHCSGDGKIKIPFSQDSFVPCPVCHGKRYSKEALDISVKDKDITQILEMSSIEAMKFFETISPSICEKCAFLVKVGLSYLKLGQTTSTLSGGEAARLKIASCLMNANMKNSLFLLDEPTSGLHFSDIDNLIDLLEEIIEAGNTVVAIEHNKRFLSAADYTITMGPGAGRLGGKIIGG